MTRARGFTLLAEVLLIGVMTTIAALGIVTAFGALAAGCASLREYLERDVAPSPRRYLSLLRAASRGAIPLLALPVLLAVVALDLLAWRAGMPGGRVLGPAALAVSALAVVIGLRAAASWSPEPDDVRQPVRWSTLLSGAGSEAASDWRGSLLIVAALAVCATLALEIPVLALTVPGLLVFAAVAVRARAAGSAARAAVGG
ncbi:hypothetical protein [Actinocrinis sp.]|uniref:hypothetical protein n=1 Tax=Actinocrinis sp. TaxID=1920516 RepID=UPI002D2A8C5C|nr:hypothetical protein [Actinocrinis sp.]HZP50408.1 hypothetical protein [Actinocrinis sp.]